MIYLDNAATTFQKPPAVWKAVLNAAQNCTTPGRGTYPAAMRAADVLLNMRENAASLFGLSAPESIILTGNATHGLNLAIHSLALSYRRAIISGYEHNAVVRALHLNGIVPEIVRAPLFHRDDIIQGFRDETDKGACFVVISHVSNVFGYRLPVEEILEICKARQIPALVDASQSAGTLCLKDICEKSDYVAMPGHKGLYGPQGTGLLICNQIPEPFVAGGTGGNSILTSMPDFLPDRLEAGTTNIPGAAGLSKGIEFVAEKKEDRILRHECYLKNDACERLSAIDGIHPIWNEKSDNQTGVFSFTSDQLSSDEVAQKLAERQIAVRAGLHCAPQAHITAGTSDNGTVRVSFSAFTTLREVIEFCQIVKEIQSRIHIFLR